MMNINLRFKSFSPPSEGQVEHAMSHAMKTTAPSLGDKVQNIFQGKVLVFSIFYCIYLAALGLP